MGTHFDGTPDQVRALDAYIKLVRATSLLTSHLNRSLKGVGLTMSQLGALEALLHLGPMCQRDLGHKLLQSGGNITTVVDNLEKRGLVERVRSADDRRFVTLHLTAAGDALIRGYFPEHAAEITALLSVLDPSEQDQLADLVRRLGRSIDAIDG